MTVEELQAQRDGYIYIHDMSARRDTMNCCLFDVGAVCCAAVSRWAICGTTNRKR
ncbi:MAG: hypothetical protein ACLR4A_05235 [Christensenellales bacterium]